MVFFAMFSNMLGGTWFMERCHTASAWLRLSDGVIGPVFAAVISVLVVELFLLSLC